MGLLEEQSRKGRIDLFYGDETTISQQGFVPYGWQGPKESVAIEVTRGRSLHCFGLLSRTNHFYSRTTEDNLSAQWVLETLDEFSQTLTNPTVVVLDNASIHTAKMIRARIEEWQQRGLFLFFLPPYSPHLNIIERLWKELKEGWIHPGDYLSADHLFAATHRLFAAVGGTFRLRFSEYKFNA